MRMLFKQEFQRLFSLLSKREREENPELMEKVREIKKKLARVRAREWEL
jgi:hypothetical protein